MLAVPKRARPRVNQSLTIPSPVGGLNARDTLITMPEVDAPLLKNFIVEPYGVGVRRGYVQHATNLGGQVTTLLTWQSGTGSKMWAVYDTGIAVGVKEVTTAGDYSAASPALTGLTNGQWRQTNFANAGGQHMVAVNGFDDPIVYNTGAGMTRLTAGNGTDAYTISGVNPNRFIALCTHQRRLWFVEKNTMKAWYLPTDAVYGVVTKFDFGPIFDLGGYLVGIFTWSKNTHAGPQNQLVVVTSEGQVAVYTGIDPASASTWALTGVFFIGAPIGYNFGGNSAGDLLLLTERALISLNLATQDAEVGLDSTKQVSSKIQKLLDAAIRDNRDEYGWQVIEYPLLNIVLINAPSTDSGIIQFCGQEVTRAWSILDGMDALCWRLFRQDLFFGTVDGTVYQGLTGYLDNTLLDGTAGTAVQFEAQQAFSLLEMPGTKYVSMIRPSLVTAGVPSIVVGVFFDYDIVTVFGDLALVEIDAAFWDEDRWNSGLWGSGLLASREWVTVGGSGYACSVRFVGRATDETYWIATDWIVQPGAGL